MSQYRMRLVVCAVVSICMSLWICHAAVIAKPLTISVIGNDIRGAPLFVTKQDSNINQAVAIFFILFSLILISVASLPFLIN